MSNLFDKILAFFKKEEVVFKAEAKKVNDSLKSVVKTVEADVEKVVNKVKKPKSK
jgi:hypothetical protein